MSTSAVSSSSSSSLPAAVENIDDIIDERDPNDNDDDDEYESILVDSVFLISSQRKFSQESSLNRNELARISESIAESVPSLQYNNNNNNDNHDRIVRLNVGGKQFATRPSTLVGSIRLHSLYLECSNKSDDDNEIFIDRNPEYFAIVLDYLRSINEGDDDGDDDDELFVVPRDMVDLKRVRLEAAYFRVHGLVHLIDRIIHQQQQQSLLNWAIVALKCFNLFGFIQSKGRSHNWKHWLLALEVILILLAVMTHTTKNVVDNNHNNNNVDEIISNDTYSPPPQNDDHTSSSSPDQDTENNEKQTIEPQVFLNQTNERYSNDIDKSTILSTPNQVDNLLSLCEFQPNSTDFHLLYRASEHGFSSDSFHAHCDKQSPVLIIIKSSPSEWEEDEDAYIFGGYTEAEWDRHVDGFRVDHHAFLFSLVNKYNDPRKLRIKPGYESYAIYSDASTCGGPCFGDAYESSLAYDDDTIEFDLFVSARAPNEIAASFTKLADVNYKNGRLPTTEPPYYFRVDEIEVYKVIYF